MFLPDEPFLTPRERWIRFIISIIISIIIFFSLINEVKIVSGLDGYEYIGTYYLYSQINQTTDDVVATIGNDYQDSSGAIPLKTSIFDLAIGLRFNNLSIPINATHRSIIQWSKLSLYTQQTTYIEGERCRFSIYYCNNDTTFTNYTNLVNRKTSVAYVNIDAYEFVGNGIWWNTTNIKDVILPPIPINNNGSIVLKILSAKGLGVRSFVSFDGISQYAPKLYVCYKLYKIKSGYYDTYRGYDIYENYTSLPPLVNIQGTSYTKWCMEIDNQDFDNWLIVDLDFFDTYWSYDYFVEIPNGTLYSPLLGILYKSNDRGITWSSLGAFIEGDEWDSGVCSVHYFNGTLHFVYNAKKTGYPSYLCMIYRNMTISDSVFGDSFVLKSSSLGSQGGANIAMDKLGNIYVGWYGAQGGSSTTRSYFRQYNITSKNWETTYNQPLTLGKHVWTGIECEQNHTGQNAWVFVCYHHWYAGSDTVIWRLRNETLSWSAETNLDSGASYVDTEMDKYNQVHTTTYESQIIHYRKYNRITGMGSVLTVDSGYYYPTIGCYNGLVYVYFTKTATTTGYYKYKVYNETTFSSLYEILDTPYIHIIPLKYFSETSLREGKENKTSYFWIDEDNNTHCCFEEPDDVKDDIDKYIGTGQVDKLPNLGSNIILWMGLCGLGMIPLGFILFVLNVKDGDWSNAFYMLMVMELIGLGFIIVWLWS